MRGLIFAAPVLAVLVNPAGAASRMPDLDPAQMTTAQKAIYDAAVSGPTGGLRGPARVWIRSPVLGQRLQDIYLALRFNTVLPGNIRELAILIAAADWNAPPFEWQTHYPLALKEGVSAAVARDVKEGRRPTAMNADEALVYDFSTQLLRTKRVSDANYEAAVKRLGERGVTELVAVLGYYALVSMTLNVGEVPGEAGSAQTVPP